MKKIVLFVYCISLFVFSIGFAVEPLKLEDFQKQQQNLLRLNDQLTGKIAILDQIIDTAYRLKIEAQKQREDVVSKFDENVKQIDKLTPAVPAPVKPKTDD